MNMKKIRKIAITWLLLVSLILPMLPSFDLSVLAAYFQSTENAYHFEAGEVAVITPEVIEAINDEQPGFAKKPTFVIHQGVFSVTVQGDVNVSIIFGTYENGKYNGVTIDRTKDKSTTNNNNIVGTEDTGYATAKDLYDAGAKLKWDAGYIPTAPFLITGNAKVDVLFLGETTIKAHVNRMTVTKNGNTYQYTAPTLNSNNANNRRCGYAGIQVDSGSSLTIKNVTGGKLNVFGSYQLLTDPESKNLNEILAQNSEWGSDPYRVPAGANNDYTNGGAAIGGGPSYKQADSRKPTYDNPHGTPGEIIIQGGEIFAVGGSHAAAIGGGFNGAASTSKIEINGGNITAVGGRFATAIGEGDSLPGANISPLFGAANLNDVRDTRVIVNGGVLELYGGAAAAAIGTTDQVSHSNGFTTNGYSGLIIEINGGRIDARSGAVNGSSNCAAIGAGENTNMRDNSITIDSSAIVFARSYSEYAISNKGTGGTVEEKVPMVNIDPDGFMYLARFNASSFDRDLTLYPVFLDSLNNPVVIPNGANETLDAAQKNTALNTTFYAKREETVNGKSGIYLYEVEWNSNTGKFEPVYQEVVVDGETTTTLKYFTGGDDFSYYYNVGSSETVKFSIPANYKAIALTMGSGDYVFHVPKGTFTTTGGYRPTTREEWDTDLTNDIFAHFNKTMSGTTSVEINEEDNGSKLFHFYYVRTGDEIDLTETPHVIVDVTAKPFNTIILNQDPELLKYDTNVLGYVIYLPHGTTGFKLQLQQDPQYTTNKGTNVVSKLNIRFSSGLTLDKASNNSLTYQKPRNGYLESQYDLNFGINAASEADAHKERTFDIWINKVDQDESNSQAFLTYKITVIVKAEYYFHIESLSKKYDGINVIPKITSVTQEKGTVIEDRFEDHVITGTSDLIPYGSHISSYNTVGSKSTLVYKDNISSPVTITYLAVPNETETSISIITTFTYEENGQTITKRSTVNINMDGKDLVFTLDGSSDTVLRASQLGNYKIVAEKGSDTNGNKTWVVSIARYDSALKWVTIPVLTFNANETTQEEPLPAGDKNIPAYSGDGKPVYKDRETAEARAKAEALNAFNMLPAADRANPDFADLIPNPNPYETRFSDSYFYSANKKVVETFEMTVNHHTGTKTENGQSYVVSTNDGKTDPVSDFTFSIKDDYIFVYYEFHYYAQLTQTGKTVEFTEAQMGQIQYVYYRDINGNGVLDGSEENSDNIIIIDSNDRRVGPRDAGDYILTMSYQGEKMEAYTEVAFEIRKRPIKILGVENWIQYLDYDLLRELHNSAQPDHLKTYPLNPTETKYDFGEVFYDDVVTGDVIDLSDHVYGYFNEITISYNASKFTLRYDAYQDANENWRGYQIDWLADKAGPVGNGTYANANRNYELTGVSNFRYTQVNGQENPNPIDFSYVHLPGVLAYFSEGTIFKKADGEFWRKFWPASEETFLKWNENGNKDDFGHCTDPDDMEHRIDYMSPSNGSHQYFVYLRTLNADRVPVYSIDIEYGSMEFVCSKTVWDVNEYQYVTTPETIWSGNDGNTNKITIINRSDAEVKFQATRETNVSGHLLDVGFSKNYNVPEDTNLNVNNAKYEGTIESAAETLGTPVEETFYLVVQGIPTNMAREQVGSIILTVTPADASANP